MLRSVDVSVVASYVHGLCTVCLDGIGSSTFVQGESSEQAGRRGLGDEINIDLSKIVN